MKEKDSEVCVFFNGEVDEMASKAIESIVKTITELLIYTYNKGLENALKHELERTREIIRKGG